MHILYKQISNYKNLMEIYTSHRTTIECLIHNIHKDVIFILRLYICQVRQHFLLRGKAKNSRDLNLKLQNTFPSRIL